MTLGSAPLSWETDRVPSRMQEAQAGSPAGAHRSLHRGYFPSCLSISDRSLDPRATNTEAPSSSQCVRPCRPTPRADRRAAFPGAALSVVAAVLMIGLVIAEFNAYLTVCSRPAPEAVSREPSWRVSFTPKGGAPLGLCMRPGMHCVHAAPPMPHLGAAVRSRPRARW